MRDKRKQQKSIAVTGITSLRRNQRTNMTNRKKTKLPYYEADTGFFEHKVKICFTDKAFQTAIQKAKITTKHSALDIEIGRAHV